MVRNKSVEITPKDHENMRTLGLSQAEYVRRKQNSQMLGRFLRLAAGGALTASAFLALNHQDKEAKAHFDKIEAKALENVDRGWNSVVVFREGATIRTAPLTVNSNNKEGPSADTVAFKVDEGNVLRVDRPIRYEDETGDVWLGFSAEGDVDGKQANPEDKVFWANFTELSNQSTNDHSYVDVYDYPDVADGHMPQILAADFTTEGQLISSPYSNLKKGGPAGVMSWLPEQSFENSLKQEQLVFNRAK